MVLAPSRHRRALSSLVVILAGALIGAAWVGVVDSLLGWIGAGLALVALAIASSSRGSRGWRAGDYEAELIRLCGGDEREAHRLIRRELKRSPELSRPGAALALVTRIRHERDPYEPPL